MPVVLIESVFTAPGRLFAVMFAAALTGCAAETQSDCVRENGGTLQGARQRRVEAVSERLLLGGRNCTVHVRVLNSGALCAFAWPDGTIYITRALADMSDDHELAAAIAHEMGHVLRDGHMEAPVALRGCLDGVTDIEAQADHIGVELLRSAGLPVAAMPSMLQKVAASDLTSNDCRRALDRRIKLIKAHIAKAS